MASDQDFEELQRVVRRQGELIETLYRHLGIGQLGAATIGVPSAGPSPDIVDAIRGGNLIGAIKIYRAQTGVGLKEAKDAVEAIARTLGH